MCTVVRFDRVCALLCDLIECVHCCAILKIGIRARRNSPRSVKMENSKIGIEKFDGSNFSSWKMQIEERSSRTSIEGEARYHDHGAVEAQGL